MEDQRADLKTYISEQNLKVRDEKDALALVRYYNRLEAIN
jgi:heat shock protein HspQ